MRCTRTQYLDSLPRRPRKIGFAEALATVKRQIKRQAIADGVIQDPRLNGPRYEWHWQFDQQDGMVLANTRGEARSLIKQVLGLRKKNRLPTSVEIVRVDPDADCERGPNPLA